MKRIWVFFFNFLIFSSLWLFCRFSECSRWCSFFVGLLLTVCKGCIVLRANNLQNRVWVSQQSHLYTIIFKLYSLASSNAISRWSIFLKIRCFFSSLIRIFIIIIIIIIKLWFYSDNRCVLYVLLKINVNQRSLIISNHWQPVAWSLYSLGNRYDLYV